MEIVKSDVFLSLCGKFSEPDVARQIKLCPGWQRVSDHGFLDRTGVHQVMERAIAGLVTLHPLTNYLDAQPVKMFEYMAAGIPVIASDFPRWREIIDTCGCGICVDPLQPDKIAQAIDFLVQNPEVAEQMGENGRLATSKYFNWQREEEKLIELYRTTLDRR